MDDGPIEIFQAFNLSGVYQVSRPLITGVSAFKGHTAHVAIRLFLYSSMGDSEGFELTQV
jgi:hypothetical protein